MTNLSALCTAQCAVQLNLQQLCAWERSALYAPALNTPAFRRDLAAARTTETARGAAFAQGVGAFVAANEPVMHSEPETA